MDFQLRDGWIEVICGGMYAGKTEELLRRIRRIEYAKREIIVFKPVIDNRYSNDEVVSHNHHRTKSVNISCAKDIVKYLGEKLPYAIAIDEVQFLDEEVVDIANYYASKGHWRLWPKMKKGKQVTQKHLSMKF